MMVAYIYETPNLPVIRKARIIASNQALVTSSDVYITALGEELKRLNTAIGECDKEINGVLSDIPALIKFADVSKYLKLIGGDQGEVYKAELANSLKRCFDEVSAVKKRCVDRVFEVETVTLSDTSRIIEQLTKERDVLAKNLPENKKELIQLRADKIKLDDALLEYETTSFIDRLLPVLKSLEESVTAEEQHSSDQAEDKKVVTHRVPETVKATIKLALAIASRVLGILNEVIKYDDLRKTRQNLVADIEKKQQVLSEAEKKIDAITDKIESINILKAVEEPRRNYVSEAGKVSQSIIHFLSAAFPILVGQTISEFLSDSKRLEDAGNALVNEGAPLVDYCNGVQGYWLRSI